MSPHRPLPIVLFALWTLGVWANRIVNIVTRNGGDGVDLARAIGFVAVGLAVAAILVVPTSGSTGRRVVAVAAWASIVLWATRIVTIPLGDYSVGFVVVHLVLAVISIALARWAMVASRTAAEPVADRPSHGADRVDATTPR